MAWPRLARRPERAGPKPQRDQRRCEATSRLSSRRTPMTEAPSTTCASSTCCRCALHARACMRMCLGHRRPEQPPTHKAHTRRLSVPAAAHTQSLWLSSCCYSALADVDARQASRALLQGDPLVPLRPVGRWHVGRGAGAVRAPIPQDDRPDPRSWGAGASMNGAAPALASSNRRSQGLDQGIETSVAY